jgi:hypothetical protein
MKQNFNLSNTKWNKRLLTICISFLFLLLANAALAKYKKPSKPSSPKLSAITTTTTRGSCQQLSTPNNPPINLTTLAPYNHIGQTVSSHPTFAWFVPDSQSFPLEFHLDEYNPNGQDQTIEQIQLQSSPGLMQFSLDRNKPGLSVGQKYLWKVVLICNPNSPADSIVAEAEIEVVEMPNKLRTVLSTTTDPLEKANLYAEFGLWYDAFTSALEVEDANVREFQFQLLEDLAEIEIKDAQNIQEQGMQLKEIVRRLKARSD